MILDKKKATKKQKKHKDNLTLEMNDGNLIFAGKADLKTESNGCISYCSTTFQRSFPIGNDIKEDQINATFKDSKLTIRLPNLNNQQQDAQHIPIQIKTNDNDHQQTVPQMHKNYEQQIEGLVENKMEQNGPHAADQGQMQVNQN